MLGCSQIAQAVDMPDKDLRRALASLSLQKVHVLNKTPDSKDIEDVCSDAEIRFTSTHAPTLSSVVA